MKSAVFFCFVSAFLFVPTLTILRFVAENHTRTDEYAQSDLRTMFAAIAADLEVGHEVTLEAPSSIMTPEDDFGISVSTEIQDANNNWIDEETGLPFRYRIHGNFEEIAIEQGLMHVMELQTEELEGGSSLSLNLTVWIETIRVDCYTVMNGNWRFREFLINLGTCSGSFSNVELGYQGRFQLDERGGQQYLGQSIGRSTVTLSRSTVNTARLVDFAEGVIIDWNREAEVDHQYVDLLFRSIMSSSLEHASETMDDYLRVLIGDRPYAAPQITLAIRAAHSSGYSCRRPEPRPRRETKLYNT